MSPRKKVVKKKETIEPSTRPHYVVGERLTPEDFEQEQQYHLTKKKTPKRKKKKN